MLGRAQRPNRARSLRITLPSMMPLVAHLAGQGEKQAGGKTIQIQALMPTDTMPPTLFVHPAFDTEPIIYMPLVALIRRPDDTLSSPLGQHILNYEPPRGLVIPAFATFDSSTHPYNHMLHYNLAMILNAGNDRLLCKVFSASLRGPAWACVSFVSQAPV